MRIVKAILLLVGLLTASTAYSQGVPNIQNWTAQQGYATSIQNQINALRNNLGPPPTAGNAGDFLMSNGTIANYYAMTGDISCSTVNIGFCTVTSSGTSTLLSIQLANAASTGTTLNKLVKLTGAPSTGVITATTDTNNAIGICVANCGTSATAAIGTVQILGLSSCVFDGATTAGDAVTISSSTAGDCHDTGSAIPPSTSEPIGFVLSTHVSGGTYGMLFSGIAALFPSTPSIPNSLVITNNTSTGTTLNKIAIYDFTQTGKAILPATTNRSGVIGLVTAGAGTTGAATIQFAGTASCVFDGATTINDYVIPSTITAGDCHDTGSLSPPAGQTTYLGTVNSTNGGGGTYAISLSIFPPSGQVGGNIPFCDVSVLTANANNLLRYQAYSGNNDICNDQTTLAITGGYSWGGTQTFSSSTSNTSIILGDTKGHVQVHNDGNGSVTVTTCGTGSVSSASTDFVGDITATGATACTVVFSGSYTKSECFVQDNTSAVALKVVNGTANFTVSGLTSGDEFSYVCYDLH